MPDNYPISFGDSSKGRKSPLNNTDPWLGNPRPMETPPNLIQPNPTPLRYKAVYDYLDSIERPRTNGVNFRRPEDRGDKRYNQPPDYPDRPAGGSKVPRSPRPKPSSPSTAKAMY